MSQTIGTAVTNREPSLGVSSAQRLTGCEPALSREFGPLYGRFRLTGLEAPPVSGRRRAVIALGEDNKDLAGLVKLVADSNGYDVHAVGDADETLAVAATESPDLIVLNIYLGGRSGFDLIRVIRGLQIPLCEKPVVVMEASHQPSLMLEAFAAGADDFVIKPYDMRTMLRVWRRAIVACHRPAPLAATINEESVVQQAALSYLLATRPPGLVKGLAEILTSVEPERQLPIRWALRQIGTPDAMGVLAAFQTEPLPVLR